MPALPLFTLSSESSTYTASCLELFLLATQDQLMCSVYSVHANQRVVCIKKPIHLDNMISVGDTVSFTMASTLMASTLIWIYSFD